MKKIIFAVLVALLCSAVFAESLEDIVGTNYAEQLKDKGSVSLIHEKNDKDMVMTPVCEYTKEIQKDLVCRKEGGIPFLAEFLYLIPKSDFTDKVEDVNIDSVSTIFRSVSKMTGMKYIHNGGKEDILYKKSYAISGVESDTPIADPLEGPIDGLVINAYQHDHTFGDTKYLISYHQAGNVLWANFKNTIPMGMLGVKGVFAGNLMTNVVCIDLGENLLLYLTADVCARNLPAMRRQIKDSMTVRMDAVHQWFLKQYR